MTDIREFEDLQELETWLTQSWDRALADFIQQSDVPRDLHERLSIDEIIISGEHGRGVQRETDAPLIINYIIDVTREEEQEMSLFNDIAGPISNVIQDEDLIGNIPGAQPPPQSVIEEFGDIVVNVMPIGVLNRRDFVNFLVNIREDDPNRAYSLTNKENIIVNEDGIGRAPVSDDDDLGDQPTAGGADILRYPALIELRDSIISSFEDARTLSAEQSDDELINGISIERVIFMGEFARGTAQKGEDPFVISIFANVPGGIVREQRVLGNISDKMIDIITPSQEMEEWASGIDIDGIYKAETFETVINSRLDPDGGRGYDITKDAVVGLEQGMFGLDVAEADADTGIPPLEDPGEDVDIEPDEPDEPLFPDVPPELRRYAKDENTVDIPINKDSKKVEPRELYDFEKEMMEPGKSDTDLDVRIRDGIGEAVRIGVLGEGQPPSTFPRTGHYIKNHLLYQGPSYAMEMHRDIVVYSGYISTKYEGRYVVGSYQSFREYLYRLREANERDLAPELIRPVPQQRLASMGISTVPELPSGQEAPWLERKQYYEIVQENIDHPAWDNITELLYGDGEQ